jgi:hypothetical protein
MTDRADGIAGTCGAAGPNLSSPLSQLPETERLGFQVNGFAVSMQLVSTPPTPLGMLREMLKIEHWRYVWLLIGIAERMVPVEHVLIE